MIYFYYLFILLIYIFIYLYTISLTIPIYFGIPIFNPKLNQQVLDRIGKHQLFCEDNLKKQSKNSRKLALRLLEFIARRIQVQDYNRFDRAPADSPHVGILLTISYLPLPVLLSSFTLALLHLLSQHPLLGNQCARQCTTGYFAWTAPLLLGGFSALRCNHMPALRGSIPLPSLVSPVPPSSSRERCT